MISVTGKRAFSFLEVIAVLALMAVVFGAVVSNFQFGSARIRSVSRDLTRDIHATHFQALKQGKIFRLQFSEDAAGYVIEYFQLEPPPPPPEEEEAYRRWEEAREAKQRALGELSREERRNLRAIDRGEFIPRRERALQEPVRLVDFKKWTPEGVLERDKIPAPGILFYPTGEVESVLLILEDDGGRSYSLITDPITGRVRTFSRRITEEEWQSALRES